MPHTRQYHKDSSSNHGPGPYPYLPLKAEVPRNQCHQKEKRRYRDSPLPLPSMSQTSLWSVMVYHNANIGMSGSHHGSKERSTSQKTTFSHKSISHMKNRDIKCRMASHNAKTYQETPLCQYRLKQPATHQCESGYSPTQVRTLSLHGTSKPRQREPVLK